ncbi:hypothetical protein, partial [Paraburkholderia heleia]|uniref:hypothetical protein n=1 Tax=Paraburkholderia heleia TaxID=634127 RepID=UPI001C3F2285
LINCCRKMSISGSELLAVVRLQELRPARRDRVGSQRVSLSMRRGGGKRKAYDRHNRIAAVVPV